MTTTMPMAMTMLMGSPKIMSEKIAIFSLIIFGEPINIVMAIGIVVVIGGVLFVEFGSHAGQRTKEEAA